MLKFIVWFACCIGSVCGNGLSLEEKVGQLLIVHFHGEEVNEEAQRLIQEVHVGGFIYYNWSNGLHHPQQIKNLSAGLQALSPIPLLIAIDQEGGRVSRLKEGFMGLLGNHELALKSPNFVRDYAFAVGQELKAVGINMNLAPVVDVNSNPANPIIGIRSFGDTPEKVVLFAEAMLEGYRKSNLITCLKHFPGHGDVVIDSHVELPVINKTMSDLDRVELVPFRKLCHLSDTVMTAHLFLPEIDPNNCASLSSIMIENVLRNEFGFKGVVISDSLVMQGLINHCSDINEAAVRAINAGTDLLILGGKQLVGEKNGFELTLDEIIDIHKYLVVAVKSKRISEQRLNEAIERILTLKHKL